MSHTHKWYISRDYDGFIEGLCEDESCMAHLTEEELVARVNAVEQMRAADIDPLCPECHCELHLTTAGDHVCRNEACGSYR